MAKDPTGRIWARPTTGLAAPAKLFWHAFKGETWKLADNTPFVAFCGRKFPFVAGWRTQGELVVLRESKVCATCLTRENRNQRS